MVVAHYFIENKETNKVLIEENYYDTPYYDVEDKGKRAPLMFIRHGAQYVYLRMQ